MARPGFAGHLLNSVLRTPDIPDAGPITRVQTHRDRILQEMAVNQRMIDRRKFARFALDPMYTPIAARTLDSQSFDIEGNAYDISEGGIRFELDRAVQPGTKIALQITLPTMNHEDIGPGRSVFVFANVVWLEDEDQPGPYKMAAIFTHFARAGDRERLLQQFATGRYRAAA